MCCTRTRKREASKEWGIELLDGERMKEVDQKGYKVLYLEDNTMNKEMKGNIGNEYIRRVKLICKSNLNVGNFISGLDA